MKIITRGFPPRALWARGRAGSPPLLGRLYAARGMARGAVLPLDQVWTLAQAWYAGRLNADYKGRSAAEIEAILAARPPHPPQLEAAE